MKNSKVKTLSHMISMLIVIQILLFCIERFIFIFVRRTNFSDHIASMIGMIVLTILFIIFARKKKVSLSVFPGHFGKFYIIGTSAAVILFVATPSNYLDGFQAIILLFYSSVVTPIFEELIFRGYIWNKLNTIFDKEWITYVVSTVLFGLWHLGYIEAVAFRTETGLAAAMLWKVITGLCFGVVLGAVRLKTKNSYSAMLLHGVMNIFGR